MRLAKPRLLGRRKLSSGFSLIEIALALGIFAFAIVAILGLLAVSMNSDKGAAVDSTLSQMTGTAISYLRSQGYTAVHTNAAFIATDTTSDFFFDSSGQLAVAVTGAPLTTAQLDSMYGCTVTRKVTTSANMDYLNLEFRWPVSAPTNRQETRTINASIANYN